MRQALVVIAIVTLAACGGSGPTGPSSTSAPAPVAVAPTPEPTPAPTPAPEPTPEAPAPAPPRPGPAPTPAPTPEPLDCSTGTVKVRQDGPKVFFDLTLSAKAGFSYRSDSWTLPAGSHTKRGENFKGCAWEDTNHKWFLKVYGCPNLDTSGMVVCQ